MVISPSRSATIKPLKFLKNSLTLSEAVNYAAGEVEEEFGDAADVANNRFIGSSNLCLRP